MNAIPVPRLIELDGTQKYRRLLSGIPDTCGMKAGLVCLCPGESIGEHSTFDREECLFIMEGRAKITCGTRVFEACQGNLMYIPKQTTHDVLNIGENLLRYVFLVAPVSKDEEQKA